MDTPALLRSTVTVCYDKLETILTKASAHGRSIELASGFGLWLVAFTLLFSSQHGYALSSLGIQHTFLAWFLIMVGLGQLSYNNLGARLFLDALGAAIWLTIAVVTFLSVGDWTIATAACSALGIFNFYIYGFILGETIADKKEE